MSQMLENVIMRRSEMVLDSSGIAMKKITELSDTEIIKESWRCF